MRTVLGLIAVAGTIAAACGVVFSVPWLIVGGVGALLIALVMAALAAPATRRRN